MADEDVGEARVKRRREREERRKVLCTLYDELSVHRGADRNSALRKIGFS